MNFNKYLKEQAQAVPGHFLGHNKDKPMLHLHIKDKTEHLKHYKLAESSFVNVEGEVYDLYRHKSEIKYKLGKFIDVIDENETKIKFNTILLIKTTRNKFIQRLLGYKKVLNVDLVFVDDEFRRNGLARLLYNYLVMEKKYAILGDSKQYFGARKLWSQLSKSSDLVVDIVNIKTGDIIDSNVVLHQGQYDSDFDKRLWKYNDSITHIRSLLKEIKRN